MTLQDWLKSSWLLAHKSSPQEIKGLLSVANRDLADAQVKGISVDACFAHAYNAALQSSLAALAAAGYRVSRGESHHHRAFQSLAYTIGADGDLISKLDKCRKKRNVSDYERAGTVSDQEAGEMIKIAKALLAKVEAWLRKEHSTMLQT
ncbi:MAG: HEPN domain-containing protein [Planctomycetes bacterium]|nr:HEPN domain-containing protein [Planctomycetota bacterium]